MTSRMRGRKMEGAMNNEGKGIQTCVCYGIEVRKFAGALISDGRTYVQISLMTYKMLSSKMFTSTTLQ